MWTLSEGRAEKGFASGIWGIGSGREHAGIGVNGNGEGKSGAGEPIEPICEEFEGCLKTLLSDGREGVADGEVGRGNGEEPGPGASAVGCPGEGEEETGIAGVSDPERWANRFEWTNLNAIGREIASGVDKDSE